MKAEIIISVLIVPLVWIVYLLLKDRIDKSESDTIRETTFLRSELGFLNQKQINLLETFVQKFEQWEKRLKELVSDLRDGKDPSRSLESFEGESERLRGYFRASTEIIREEIKKLEKTVRTREDKSIHGAMEVSLKIEAELKKQSENFEKFYEILRALNLKDKELERMIRSNQIKIASLEKNISFGKISIK